MTEYASSADPAEIARLQADGFVPYGTRGRSVHLRRDVAPADADGAARDAEDEAGPFAARQRDALLSAFGDYASAAAASDGDLLALDDVGPSTVATLRGLHPDVIPGE